MAIATSIDKVRLEIGDRNMDAPLFTDDEIQYYLDQRSDNILLAAADCCDSLATRFASDIDFTTDTLSVKKLQRSQMMAKRAEQLRDRASGINHLETIKVDGYSQDLDNVSTTLVTSDNIDPDIPRYGPSWQMDLVRREGGNYVSGN